ncbi:hypothetical protein [Rhodobium gokarnense]|uniref:Uncharacterized protein n=1 Tax=Rhodobium gokarnense TaxID=364296 RepID=A0ABT3HGG5_9HYPH|nr:hypothetical protein [Rhodobium gokarnense]MCW2309470.1 hypothetical protein [Rhodobium gokarnense]
MPWKRIDLSEADLATATAFCSLAPFGYSEVWPGDVPGTWFLMVSGVMPCKNMVIQLRPMVYVQPPDYWAIEVVGCVEDGCLEMPVTYAIWIDVTDYRGTDGIEVVGANGTQKLDIPG